MLIWGLTFIATKIALREFPPFQLSVARLALAWLVLYPFARREGLRLRSMLQPELLWLGLTGVALFYGFETIGMQYTSAASGSLFQAALPCLTAFFSFLFLKEKLSRMQFAGIALSILGVILITLTGALHLEGDSLLGSLLVLVSLLSWVAYTILGKRMTLRYSSLVITTATMGAGLLFLLPFGGIELAVVGAPHPTLAGWSAFLFLSLGGSAAAYYFWNHALQFMDANTASPFINLIPVVGLIAALLWGEPVSIFQLAGGALAIAGVWLSSIK